MSAFTTVPLRRSGQRPFRRPYRAVPELLCWKRLTAGAAVPHSRSTKTLWTTKVLWPSRPRLGLDTIKLKRCIGERDSESRTQHCRAIFPVPQEGRLRWWQEPRGYKEIKKIRRRKEPGTQSSAYYLFGGRGPAARIFSAHQTSQYSWQSARQDQQQTCHKPLCLSRRRVRSGIPTGTPDTTWARLTRRPDQRQFNFVELAFNRRAHHRASVWKLHAVRRAGRPAKPAGIHQPAFARCVLSCAVQHFRIHLGGNGRKGDPKQVEKFGVGSFKPLPVPANFCGVTRKEVIHRLFGW